MAVTLGLRRLFFHLKLHEVEVVHVLDGQGTVGQVSAHGEVRGHVSPCEDTCSLSAKASGSERPCPVLSCKDGAGRVGRFTHNSTAVVSLILVRRTASIYGSRTRRAPHVQTHLHTCQVASAVLLLTTSLRSKCTNRNSALQTCLVLVFASVL